MYVRTVHSIYMNIYEDGYDDEDEYEEREEESAGAYQIRNKMISMYACK